MSSTQPGQPQIPTVPEVDADAAERMIANGAVALDVRETWEFTTGVISGAVLVPRADVPERVRDLVPDLAAPVVVYCAGGLRSAYATKTLVEMGYTGAVSLAGGLHAWEESGKPTTLPG